MYILIGLGNPGPQYAHTRHNAGALLLEKFAEALDITFQHDKKSDALIAEAHIQGQKVLLVKPETFMNCSGESVRKILSFYKVPLESLLVLHDDLDLSSGTVRCIKDRGAAGHNGVQNIIDLVGTKDFARLRIGIGRPLETLGVCMRPHDYVLQNFTEAEWETIITAAPKTLHDLLVLWQSLS